MRIREITSESFYLFCDTLVENIGWYFNDVLRSFSFVKKGEEWLLSVKVAGVGKGRIVFIRTKTIGDCIKSFWSFCRNPPFSGYNWVMAKW